MAEKIRMTWMEILVAPSFSSIQREAKCAETPNKENFFLAV